MSTKNPNTVRGNKGRVSHKRFPKASKARVLKEAKLVALVKKAIVTKDGLVMGIDPAKA